MSYHKRARELVLQCSEKNRHLHVAIIEYALEQVEREALERAAAVCNIYAKEHANDPDNSSWAPADAMELAVAIRALKPPIQKKSNSEES